MRPKLENKKDGSRVLYVFYDNRLADFDQAIEQAEKDFNVEGNREITVICLPANGLMNRRMK